MTTVANKTAFCCAVCEGATAWTAIELQDYPAFLMPVPLDRAETIVRSPLRLVACRDCGHLQVPDPDLDVQRRIYEEYYVHYCNDDSNYLAEHYRKPFQKLIEATAASGRLPCGSLLEIGCSSGKAIPFFTQFCDTYTGIDPSERIDLARHDHPEHAYIRGYFPQALEGQKYDVIVSQFNLEHIVDLSEFLVGVYASLNVGGVFIVQVPDVGFYARTGQSNFLAHEHVHYFDNDRLDLLLRRYGFDPIAHGPSGPSLICAARLDVPHKEAVLPAGVDPLGSAKLHTSNFERRPKTMAKHVILYGASPLAAVLLADIPEHQRVTIVDDNPNFQACGVPGYAAPVTKLEASMIDEHTEIILTLNVIYHDRVIEKLNKFDRAVTVHALQRGAWNTLTLGKGT